MKIFSVILAAMPLVVGCALPQISQQDVQTMVTAAQQAQELYHTVQPLVEEYLGKEPVYERGRSPQWPRVRDEFIRAHPRCDCCGHPAEEVHHVIPFHVMPELELEPANLISLCWRDHFLVGHLCDWRSYNVDVFADARAWRAKIASRP